MKNTFLSAIIMIALCACGHDHSAEAEHNHVHLHNFTAYSGANEFFMQHEGLEVGSKSCITLFVTELDAFDPTAVGEAKATLKVGDNEQSATVSCSKAGVFNFDFVPQKSGSGSLFFEVGGDMARFPIEVNAAGHSHDHGHAYDHSAHAGHDHASHAGHNHADHAGHDHSHDHAVHEHNHDHAAHAEHAHAHASCEGHDHGHSHTSSVAFGAETEGAADDVAFSKEQSWKIDFATAVVEKKGFGGAVKVAAKVVATPQNFTTIVAATSGRVQFVGNVVEGKDVVADEPLFYLEGGDVTDNDAAVKYAEVESAYLLAKADYERKKLLLDEKVVSERDFQAA